MSEEKFGIDKLKETATAVANEINVVDAQLADGFQAASDLFPILIGAAPLTAALQAKQEIANEWKDLSDSEISELTATFNGALKLRNQAVQGKVQKIVNAVAANAIAIKALF